MKGRWIDLWQGIEGLINEQSAKAGGETQAHLHSGIDVVVLVGRERTVSLQLLLVGGLCWVIDIAAPYAFQRERPNFKRRQDSEIARPSLESTKETSSRVGGYG